jgi:hypothetical protein
VTAAWTSRFVGTKRFSPAATRDAQLYNFRPSCIDAGGETITREMRR